MNTRKLLQRTFSVTLFVLYLSGYSSIHAQPSSGDWRFPTDFGELGFTVNPDGTKITELIIDVSNWSCGNVSGSWTTTVSFVDPTAGWPISDSQFSIESSSTTGTWTIDGTFSDTGDEASGTWSFEVSGTVCSGNWSSIIVSVEEVGGGIPERFVVAQNYPNPFNSNTTIQFALPRTIHISIKVYNALGLEVETLVNKQLPAGQYNTTWNAADFASGVYVCRIQAGNFVETKKLILLK